jgi:BirA family biotin operon repressor/biotin-[acetyl-CoA-carboxylase] ligase
MISPDEIQRGLKTKLIGKSIHSFQVIGSTNVEARKLAERGAPEGTTTIAEHQTTGRGRFNRKWYGEPEKNILLSLILRPREAQGANLLTYLTALSAAETVEQFTGKIVECKWPNDLLINGRKISGILLESSWRESMIDFVVIGIGVNVNQEEFPIELRHAATSMKIECRHEFDRVALIRGFLEGLERKYLHSWKVGYDGFVTEWKRKCPTLGKEISVAQSGKILKGKAIDLDTDGALIIESRDRVTRVFAGDVRVLS